MSPSKVPFHVIDIGNAFKDGNKVFVKNTHHTAVWKPSPTSFIVGYFNHADLVEGISNEELKSAC